MSPHHDTSWIFGYGSLIWKAGFRFEERRRASVTGWVRRFWQESADHRGTPSAPGRVVTLVPDAAGKVWGVAYRLPESKRAEILAGLDIREQGGYQRTLQSITDSRGATLSTRAVVYVGDETNPHYAGPASTEDIAALIVEREGPSGHNVEYLLTLAAMLAEMGVHDPHVTELARLAKEEASEPVQRRFASLFER